MTSAPPPKLRRNPSLSELFNHFVAEAEYNFPKLRGNLVVHDLRRNKTYVSSEFNHKAPKKTRLERVDAFIKERRRRGDFASYEGEATKVVEPLAETILFTCAVKKKEINALSKKKQAEILFILEHELGHMTIKDAYSAKGNHASLVQEAIAEAFAYLMHCKRFGIETPIARGEEALDMLNVFATTNPKVKSYLHYTTIQQIVAVRHLIDFETLKPAQLAQMARRFAIENTLSDAQVRDMTRAFAPCRKAIRQRKGNNGAMQVISEIAEKTEHPHVARACVDLFFYLKKKNAGRTHGVGSRKLFEKMNKLREKIYKEDILFRAPGVTLPKTRKPAAPTAA